MNPILERLLKLVELKKALSEQETKLIRQGFKRFDHDGNDPHALKPKDDRHLLRHLGRLTKMQKGIIGNQPVIANAPTCTNEPEFKNKPVVVETKEKK